MQDVDRFANALRINCDVRSGDVISVWTANAYFFVVVQYASAALGAVLCPINAYYKAKEVQYCLEKVKPKVLIMPGECLRRDLCQRLETGPGLELAHFQPRTTSDRVD